MSHVACVPHCVGVCGSGWLRGMFVRFVRVIRVPAFVPCVSRLPPVSFYRYERTASVDTPQASFSSRNQHSVSARSARCQLCTPPNQLRAHSTNDDGS